MKYDTRTVREGGSFAMEDRSNKLQRKRTFVLYIKNGLWYTLFKGFEKYEI